MTTAAQQWRDDLASWAIPDEILEQAPQNPWIHPVAQFLAPDGPIPDSPAHQAARDALPAGGSVLDVGCGGGRAALALVPPAGLLIGVDHQQGMLDAFAEAAAKRGVASETILGDWPDVADVTPMADVVVCHHVAYNVWELPDFVRALTTHARHRVVLELPVRHPLSWMNPLWKQFWDLDRPNSPTADDALTVIRETGYDAQLVEFDDVYERIPLDPTAQGEAACIRLCLPLDRADDVAAAAAEADAGMPRRLAAIWWEV
ncbi:MAG: class I SAM-dependent methyltransferase [Candidatus Nanopelagicales bacterium]|jgi:SAM-dependent methyltransferase